MRIYAALEILELEELEDL